MCTTVLEDKCNTDCLVVRISVFLSLILSYFSYLAHVGISHSRKPTRPSSSTSGVGVAGRRGKRKRPPVEEDEDGDDDAFVEGSGGRGMVLVEGRERYINSLLKQLIKVKYYATLFTIDLEMFIDE